VTDSRHRLPAPALRRLYQVNCYSKGDGRSPRAAGAPNLNSVHRFVLGLGQTESLSSWSSSHWIMVIMDVFTRRIISFGVERADPCGASTCQMFNQIIAGKSLPRHLSCDYDPLYGFHRWLANLHIFESQRLSRLHLYPCPIRSWNG